MGHSWGEVCAMVACRVSWGLGDGAEKSSGSIGLQGFLAGCGIDWKPLAL